MEDVGERSDNNPPLPRATAEELIARYGHLARPALHLVPGNSGGFSRLGGLPEMPEDLVWPEWEGKPLAFLAQLSLAELHEAEPSFLPASGFLYFFYDVRRGVWGFGPEDLGGWQVLFTTHSRECMVKRPAPDGPETEFVFREKPVAPRRIELLPDSPYSAEDWERDSWPYSELRFSAFNGERLHQVLGEPTPVHDEMEDECEAALNAVERGASGTVEGPPNLSGKESSADWKLLLQLDSDNDTGWIWCDAGLLYFWVREADARRGDFSKVWMILQTT
jgi:uncharacterized protein YwqG